MNKKNIMVPTLLVSLISSVLYFMNQSQEQIVDVGSNQNSDISQVKELPQSTAATLTELSTSSVGTYYPTEIGQHYEEYVDWRRNEYGELLDHSSYSGYQTDTLSDMAEAGDFLAIHVLAARFKKSNNFEKALSTYSKAVVLGSTYALNEMANIKATISNRANDFSDSKVTAQLSRNNTLTKLAHLQAAYLRGDSKALVQASTMIKVSNLTLHENEIKAIREEGSKMFDWINRQRKQAGLGGFKPTPKFIAEFEEKTLAMGFDLVGENKIFTSEVNQAL